MSIANKLIYLNGTKDKLKESINNIGGSITNETTFRNYATELDNIYDSLPKVTGTGSSLNLKPTLKGKMKLDKVLGDTYQYSTTGKNIIDLTTGTAFPSGAVVSNLQANSITLTGTSAWGNSAYIFSNPEKNATFTINGNFLSSLARTGGFSVYGTNEVSTSGMTSLQATTGSVSANTKTNFVATFNSGTYDYICIRIWNNYTGTALGSSVVLNVTEIQLEKNSSATSFEPYTGKSASPSPSYSQPIEVVTGEQQVLVRGTNLFDRTNASESTGFVWATGAERSVAATENDIVTPYIQVDKFTQLSTNYPAWFFFYDKDNTYLGQNDTLQKQSSGTFRTTITIPFSLDSTIYYVRLWWRSTDNGDINMNNQNIMLNIGTTAESYVAYSGNTYKVNLASKNLFDKDNIVSNVRQNINTGEISSDTTYSLTNYIPVEQATYVINEARVGNASNYGIVYYDENKTFVGGISWTTLGYSTNAVATNITFTISNTSVKYVRVNYRNADTNISTMQIEKGSSSTTYENYWKYELCKIGTYQDSIYKTSGKNLYNKEDSSIIFNGFINASANTLQTNNNARTICLPCLPNTTYTISKIASQRFIRAETSSDTISANMSLTNVYGKASATEMTYTTSASAKYLLVFYYLSTADTLSEETIRNSIMINKGSSALPYEPYGSGKWYKVSNVGSHKFTGASDESWGVSQTGTANWFYNITNFNTDLLQPFNSGNDSAFSNYYQAKSITSSTTNQGFYIGGNSNSHLGFLRVRYGTEDTASNYKTWLSTHNLIIYYALYEPVYTEITNTTLIEQLNNLEKAQSKNGQTNISINGNLPMILNIGAIKGE